MKSARPRRLQFANAGLNLLNTILQNLQSFSSCFHWFPFSTKLLKWSKITSITLTTKNHTRTAYGEEERARCAAPPGPTNSTSRHWLTERHPDDGNLVYIPATVAPLAARLQKLLFRLLEFAHEIGAKEIRHFLSNQWYKLLYIISFFQSSYIFKSLGT